MSYLARYRHAQLLATLTLLLIVEPFLNDLMLGAKLLNVLLVVTLISAILACANRRRHVVIGVSLATGVLIAMLSRDGRIVGAANVGLLLLAICFFGYVIALILGSVFRDSRKVSVDTICGGLSVYLLLGLLWVFAFALLEKTVPGSFSGIEPGISATSYERFFGFSFVTLTTLGSGNIVPLTPRADALAVSEAIVGQIYLTVLVARLVALNLIYGADQSET
ncbi:MAG: ion channel [Myxococcota bacterium]